MQIRFGLACRSLVVAAALLAGQAAGAAADPQGATGERDTATVVFYRGIQLLGAAVGHTIYDGDARLDTLRNGTHFAVELPAGPHRFHVNSFRQYPLDLDLEPGQTYYVASTLSVDAPHPVLEVSNQETFDAMNAPAPAATQRGSIPVAYPAKDQPIAARAGEALVFGRLKVAEQSGDVIFPVQGLSTPSDPTLVERFEPNLSLLQLGPLSTQVWSPRLKFRADGTLTAWVPPGHYALASISPKRGGKARTEIVAIIRVPADAAFVYAGDLSIRIELEPTGSFLESQPYWVASADVTDRQPATRKLVETRYGPLPSTPVVSMWCIVDDSDRSPANIDHAAAIGRLNLGCGTPPAPSDEAQP